MRPAAITTQEQPLDVQQKRLRHVLVMEHQKKMKPKREHVRMVMQDIADNQFDSSAAKLVEDLIAKRDELDRLIAAEDQQFKQQLELKLKELKEQSK